MINDFIRYNIVIVVFFLIAYTITVILVDVYHFKAWYTILIISGVLHLIRFPFLYKNHIGANNMKKTIRKVLKSLWGDLFMKPSSIFLCPARYRCETARLLQCKEPFINMKDYKKNKLKCFVPRVDSSPSDEELFNAARKEQNRRID